MSSAMLAFGAFRFSIDTAAYDALVRRTSYRWEKVDRHQGVGAWQFAGQGEDVISLDGTVFPHYRGGLGQIDAMRALAATGEPQSLVDGLGRNHGLWFIKSVAEKQAHIDGQGVPYKQGFTLEIAAYGEDRS